jgi:hypothetical protein
LEKFLRKIFEKVLKKFWKSFVILIPKNELELELVLAMCRFKLFQDRWTKTIFEKN